MFSCRGNLPNKLVSRKYKNHLSFVNVNTTGGIKMMQILKKPTFYIIAAAVIILAVIFVSLIRNPPDDSAWLTETEIIDTLDAHDLALEKDNSKNPSDYAIGGIKPGIFKLKESDGTLYIYVFDNLNERYNQYNHWESDSSGEVEFDGWVNAYQSKNASIFLEAPFGDGNTLDSNETSEFSKLTTVIFDSVFLYLNDGKTSVYHGESEHWRGTYTLKYYNNPIEDANGKLHMDNYGWDASQLAYLGDDPKNVGNISYKYDRAGGGGEGNGANLNDEGVVNLGGSGGNGAGSTPPQEVTFTVIWNGQEEIFVLRP